MQYFTIKKLMAFTAFLFWAVAGFAQDTKKIDININAEGDNIWYMQPWAWVAGGAVFILLLVALLRRRKS
jgi:hypothetical protein